MNNNQEIEPKVKAVLKGLAGGQLIDGMYETVSEYRNEFLRMGITPYDLKGVMELKRQVAFLPDTLSYSVERPGRGDFLLENFDNFYLKPVSEGEMRYLCALRSYYQQVECYQQKMANLSQIAQNHLKPKGSNYYKLDEGQELGLLVDILLNKDIDQYTFNSSSEQRLFLEKFDLYDAYQIDDDRVTLKLKAGEMLESKGYLEKGSTERVLSESGYSVKEIRDNLCRYKIDQLRVSAVELLSEGNKRYIRCMVDSDYLPARELSVRDANQVNRMHNKNGMAVKYYADILDKNRKYNGVIANEKTLVRMSMPYVDRLIDIYKHGMNEQDVMLSDASKSLDIDSFWDDIMIRQMDTLPVESQKEWAFERLTECISDLRPGMLDDEEVTSLIEVEPVFSKAGRGVEHNLMELPESFFRLIEQSDTLDREVIDYVKVQRNIGRMTPTTAYNSMCYFLSNRLVTELDPVGADDEFGRVVGCNFYPNKDMKNPAEMFPPNLLSEEQWRILGNRYSGEAAEFIPYTAFRKNRVTGVQVYPMRNGELNIRCMVDDVQQSGRQLSEGDATRYKDGKTDLNELAVGYFADAFAKEEVRSVSLKR